MMIFLKQYEETKKSTDPKIHVQPLPDSEYNSDSLLEFLNNTENIEEYLNNLGKEDIPSIVNMLDKAEGTESHKVTNNKLIKIPSPKKKDSASTSKKSLNMDIDVLDSDIEIVKELLVKEIEPKKIKLDKTFSCFACKAKLSSIQKLSHHLSICDNAVRTCVHCNILFDSKLKMRHHALTHSVLTPLSCNCGQEFESKEKLLHHSKKCEIDHIASMGFSYSCKICGEKFSERFQLFKHARAHILKSEERECKLCGSKFVGDDALLKHEKKLHEKDNKVLLRCKICFFTSTNHKEIFNHVKTHTEVKEPQRHLCESCGRSFATNASLQRHSLQHEPKCYKCFICNEKFSSARLRDTHVVEHVDVTMCEKCGDTLNCAKLDMHICN
ncbi:unnamed protein product, partial [Brenthis ino]